MARVYKPFQGGDRLLHFTEREYKILKSLIWTARNTMDEDAVGEEYLENLKFFNLVPRNAEPSPATLKRTAQTLINSII